MATIWNGADIFQRQGLQLAVSSALVRVLSPKEFGTIAALYLFIGIACAFAQRQEVSQADESTVFRFNAAIGGAGRIVLVSDGAKHSSNERCDDTAMDIVPLAANGV